MARKGHGKLELADNANPYLIRFTAPPKLVGYLNLLAQDTLLGATADKVALALLTIEVERRLLSDYHKVTVPTRDLPQAASTAGSAQDPSSEDA